MLTPLICAKYAWLRLAPAAGCYNKVNLYSLKRHFMCLITQGRQRALRWLLQAGGAGRGTGRLRRGGARCRSSRPGTGCLITYAWHERCYDLANHHQLFILLLPGDSCRACVPAPAREATEWGASHPGTSASETTQGAYLSWSAVWNSVRFQDGQLRHKTPGKSLWVLLLAPPSQARISLSRLTSLSFSF